MHRFFVSPAALATPTVSLHEPELVHQIGRVLRMRVGSEIILLGGDGDEYIVELTVITPKEICGRVIERHANLAEPAAALTLFQALPKNPSKFETVLQHGTEIGITHFVPLISERTEVRALRNLDRLTRIIRESAEQSERGRLPTLADATDFTTLTNNSPTGINLIADSYATDPLLSDLIPTLREAASINLFIGPEGGFTEREITGARAAGWVHFSLGRRILRTETAGLAIASAILFG